MGYKIYNYRGTEQDLLKVFNELFGNVECGRRKPSWDDYSSITVDVPCQKSKATIKFKDILDDVKQVIYNEPATIVTFSDGSKVCVKCCEKDKFSKEAGLIYAIVKRLYANDIEQKSGYMKSTGLGEKLNKLINGALDQKEQERERRRKQKEKQAKKEKAEAEKSNLANEVSEQAAKEAVDQIYNEPAKK